MVSSTPGYKDCCDFLVAIRLVGFCHAGSLALETPQYFSGGSQCTDGNSPTRHPASLELLFLTPQTQFMPHTYLLFDFATDEEKAQLARLKLETWKQAFRLDKKLLYKFDRAASGDGAEPSSEEEKPAKPAKEAKAKGAAKSKSKSKAKSQSADADAPDTKEASPPEPVKLLIRLDFSSHEKLSEQRWVDRIPTEEPFQAASPKVIKPNDSEFADTEKQFEDLA